MNEGPRINGVLSLNADDVFACTARFGTLTVVYDPHARRAFRAPGGGYNELSRMTNIIAFAIKSPIVPETEGLPDHISAMQAKMFLAVFGLKDSINELSRLVETDGDSTNEAIGH
jgi:hypothetical protein